MFPDRVPVGFYPWSKSDLGPALTRIEEASTSFPFPPEGPDLGRRVSPSAVSDPSRGSDRVFITPRPSRGVVSFVALGLSGHPPKGGFPRYLPRGVLRGWSRPVSGSCRGAVPPLTGGFPHISRTSGPASRGTGGGVSPPPPRPRGKPRPVTPCQRAPGGPLRDAIRALNPRVHRAG